MSRGTGRRGKGRRDALAVLLLGMLLLWAAPLAGLAAAGRALAPYLRFPPGTEPVVHAPFSWKVFLVLSLPLLGAGALYFAGFARARASSALLSTPVSTAASPARGFPWWGWLGFALIGAGWVLAWKDGLVDPAWRRHTFTPLWLGYVLVMNALAYRASGVSLLTHRTGWLIALFVLSAGFWWLFEHLNQFVGNWHYTGVEAASAGDYFWQATLPFSTVLPAVASTWAWLRTFPRFEALRLPPLRAHPALAWGALGAALFALAGIGVWPEALYAALWMAPPLLLLGLQQVLLGETLLTPLAQGDWRWLLQPALAALVCGFFWELWNSGSLAQWHYSIPYVDRFHVFEMPLLGYAGYLPFGLTCALVMDLAARIVAGQPLRRLLPPPAIL